MTKSSPEIPEAVPVAVSAGGEISTTALRVILERVSDAALLIDVETAPDKAAKFSSLLINLTKTIRDTESYNQKLNQAGDTVAAQIYDGTLEERLKGFRPGPEELAKMRRELKERLQILGPRLFEDDELQ